MPFKLVLFILCMIISAVFTGLNLENACDINFGFVRFDKVPVFLTILFSFLSGVLIILPFTFGKRKGSVSAKAEKKLFAKKEKGEKGAPYTISGEHTDSPPQSTQHAENKKW